jgi:two-component system, cell cycle sensor histidine kinase and response regulator CckA
MQPEKSIAPSSSGFANRTGAGQKQPARDQSLLTEDGLQENGATFRRIATAVVDAIVMVGKQGRISFWNDGAQAMFGYSPEEAVGKRPHELLAPASYREAYQAGLARFQQSGAGPLVGKTVELTACRKGGQEFRIELSITPIRLDGQWQAVGIIRDLTARKQAEQEFRESQERFTKAFKSNPAPMVISEIETGRIIDVNDQWLKMLGLTSEETLGNTTKELGIWTEPELRDRIVTELRIQGCAKEIPARFLTKSGELRSTLWSAERMALGGREVMLSLIYDYTEREQAETEQKRLLAELIQAQKQEAIGQLAGGVAHDFNNILSAILMHLALIQMDEKLGAGVQGELKELEAEAQRAAALTRQLLIFSRREVVRAQVFDLNSLVGNLLKMLRRIIGEHINLELRGPSEDLWLEADPGMAEQVVMNLVVNARDAMPKGGRVTLHTQIVEFDETVCNRNPEARPGRFVCLAVSDTGCGVEPATMKRIFEPFFTTKEPGKGTGLGLATVHAIVKQHQGWVEVESVVGQGSTFSVFLPAHQPVSKASTGSAPAVPLPRGNETLLLVEDEKAVRTTQAIILKRLGYCVLEAENAQEAMKVWQTKEADVALVITDLVMPGGTTGLELAEQLLKKKATLKAILVSGYCAELVNSGVPESDRVQFMAKPLTAARLAKAVRELLDTK